MASIHNFKDLIRVNSIDTLDDIIKHDASQIAGLLIENCQNLTNEQWTNLANVRSAEEFSKLAVTYINPWFYTKYTLVKTINNLSFSLLKQEKRVLNSILFHVQKCLSYSNSLLLNPLDHWAAKNVLRASLAKKINPNEPALSKEEIDRQLARQIDTFAKSPKDWANFKEEIREFLLESLKTLPDSREKFPNFQEVIFAINNYYPAKKIAEILKDLSFEKAEQLLTKFSVNKLLEILDYPLSDLFFKHIINLINKSLAVSHNPNKEKNQIADKIFNKNLSLSQKFLFLEICNPPLLLNPVEILHDLFFKLYLEDNNYALQLLKLPHFQPFIAELDINLKNEKAKKILSENLSATEKFKFLESCNPKLLKKPNQELIDLFFKLFLENSEYALKLLRDRKFYSFRYYFDFSFLKTIQLQMTCHDKPEITENIQRFWEEEDNLKLYILLNFPNLADIFIKNIFKCLTEEEKQKKCQIILENIFKFDSDSVLQKVFNLLSPYSQCSLEKMCEGAARHNAPKCLFYLTSNNSLSQQAKERIAKEASVKGYAEIVMAVCKNDVDEVNKFLFSDLLSQANRDLLEERLLRIMRFTHLHKVKILQTALSKTIKPNDNLIFLNALKAAKKAFKELAPFISRHKRPFELDHQSWLYTHLIENKDTVKEDLAYAQSCRKNIIALLAELNSKDFNPDKPPFSTLPKSSKGTHRAAALLEKISNIRYLKQKERAAENLRKKRERNHPNDEDFKNIRKHGWKTPIGSIYYWANPLINAVFNFSKAVDIARFHHEGYSEKTFNYRLKYKNTVLTEVYPVNYTDYWLDVIEPSWRHGKAPLSETWQAIEDIFEELMAFDLTQTKDKKIHQDKLTKFYELSAELVWLIGNTQPMERGSGTFAEWMLGIVHLKHGMNPPILKVDFPQLDVLDITFPLSDYKRLFTYFFEQSTIPKHLRRPNSDEPLLKQMEKLYSSIS